MKVILWIAVTVISVAFFSWALGRAFDHEYEARQNVVLPAGYVRLEREVAVLLCSHTWSDAGGKTYIRHEVSLPYRACVRAYNQTGIVP